MFKQAASRFGPYYVYVSRGTQITNPNRTNVATFLNPAMTVTPLRTTRFQTDLTDAMDDVLVSVISLLLLLAIQAILTGLLLRARPSGSISSFAFSLAHVLHLFLDFRPHRAVARLRPPRPPRPARPARPRAPPVPPVPSAPTRAPPPPAPPAPPTLPHPAETPTPVHPAPYTRRPRRRINPHLAFAAALLLAVTFALEFAVIFLTSPGDVPVPNSVATLGLTQPVIPRYRTIRPADLTGVFRPCGVLFMRGVELHRTRVTTCLTSSHASAERVPFTPIRETRNDTVVITTLLHEYGAKHFLTVNDQTAEYDAKAYLRLEDGRGCLLPQRTSKRDPLPAMRLAHRTLIGFLASAYEDDTKHSKFSVKLLDKLVKRKTVNTPGPDIAVVKVNKVERFLRVVSESYTSEFEIPAIGANPSLSFARTIFKAMCGVEVTGPATADLFTGSGSKGEHETVVWFEGERKLNWLSLIIVLASALCVLIAVRTMLTPVSPTEIASIFVKKAVGAESGRGPVQLDAGEDSFFSLGVSKGDRVDNFDVAYETDFDYDSHLEKEVPSWRSNGDLYSLSSQSDAT